jgi:hypothetical protein
VGWRLALAGILAASAVWSYVLLDRSPQWLPWLRVTVLAAGLAGAVLIVVADRLMRSAAVAVAGLGILVALAGPAAYSLQTAATLHSGALPSAGPTVAGRLGGFGRGVGPGGQGGPPNLTRQNFPGNQGPPSGQNLPSGQPGPGSASGTAGSSVVGRLMELGRSVAFSGGAAGGLLDASRPSAALVTLLEKNADRYTWVAATVGAQSAAGYQLATGCPVMSLGGFNGSDPYPTLAQFATLVRSGKVHYFIASGLGGGGGGSAGDSSMSAIASWVAATYNSTTVGGITLYNLTSPTS